MDPSKFLSVESTLAGIMILMLVQVLYRVGIFAFETFKKKSSDDQVNLKNNTLAIQNLTVTIARMEQQVIGIPKMQKDLRRSFTAIKTLAGKDWPKIRQEIEEEDILNG